MSDIRREFLAIASGQDPNSPESDLPDFEGAKKNGTVLDEEGFDLTDEFNLDDIADSADEEPSSEGQESGADDADETPSDEPESQEPEPKSDAPEWAQTMQAELEAMRQRDRQREHEKLELQRRLESYERGQQGQQQQPQEEEVQYYADNRHIEHLYQLTSERARFERAILIEEQRNPGFVTEMGEGFFDQAWNNYSQNPQQFGGFNQQWGQAFQGAYQQKTAPKARQEKDARIAELEAEVAALKKQNDEVDRKREAKRQKDLQQLNRVPRSGGAYQEPQPVIDRNDKGYKSVRGEFLRIARGAQ